MQKARGITHTKKRGKGNRQIISNINYHKLPINFPLIINDNYMFILKMATLPTLLTFVAVGQEVRRCKQMEAGVGKGDI